MDFLSKCDQIRRKLQIWLHLLKKSLMKNFIFCAVIILTIVFSILNFLVDLNSAELLITAPSLFNPKLKH